MTETIAIVLPVYNEEEVIESVVRDYYKKVIKKLPGSQLVVVEDGSTDNTKEILKKLKKQLPIRLYMGKERKGYFRALKDALRIPRTDIIFFSDTDRQHKCEDFWKLYQYRHDYDVVSGMRGKRSDSRHRVILSRSYNFILGMLFGLNARDSNSGFKMIRKEVIDSVIDDMKHIKYGFSSEFLIRAQKKGYKIIEVPIEHIRRNTGRETQFEIRRLPKAVSKQLFGIIKLRIELLR